MPSDNALSNSASRLKRLQIVDALRQGAVPKRGLELFAVGLDRFAEAVDEELDQAAITGKFKALRGEYGTGKTFFARWLENRALAKGFATAVVQISENDTPLYRMETVYRRALESLQTREWSDGAFLQLIDGWFYALEDEVLAAGRVDADDPAAVTAAVGELLEQRLAAVSATQPLYATALRACHKARVEGDAATAEGLLAWLMAQPNVGAGVKRAASIKGEVDHRTATGFLRGLLAVLKQTGRRGLVLVLDEVETIQRTRDDSRRKSLNALRQLIDDIHAERYPGLYVLITGTPLFFDGPQGIRLLPPLAQRLETDFSPGPAFDNAKAIQIRLHPFDLDKLVEVGRRVRDLYPTRAPERMAARLGDGVLRALATGVAGRLGGRVGIAPRIFLRKLVEGLLDRIDQFPDFDPEKHFELVVDGNQLSA
ncbi:MAG: BREX system ATP-binding protein BrxD, partial [bacterium]|nr:BREX system ATP-binding protein BrxD [bacterium]